MSDYITKAWTFVTNLDTSELAMMFLPVVVYWGYSSMFFALEALNMPFLEKYRIDTSKRAPVNPPLNKVLFQVFSQHTVQMALAIVLAMILRDDKPRVMESWYIVIAKLVIGAIILDTYQYWMHRYMHTNRYLYRTIHSVHHQLTAPYAFGALYNHPVEGLLMDTLGSGIASVVTNMHPWTSTIFFTLATLKTVDDHCGYALPWDPLQRFFSNNAKYHDIHHFGKGIKYNFSQPFFINWDKWCGTDYDDAMARLAKRAEASSNNNVVVKSAEGIKGEIIVSKFVAQPKEE
ncbi:hypothetical protein SmJEL517_g00425 [Synchytrium microbalum]|uniref:Fatty acid hydroxylase domain-containing protein n=1 Tax=Synchytrium microbalum TaxID=1806994 RepID=A0A507CIG9_9FUNG|nr:uncharacterized protein SmJEL517_g00425 [Synchytrium microbalum]TPX37996.1 hypothetical protein SmJEL517_g00425 [Synchytrium microbalum]